mmetsp:Transcript_101837/g.263182  ORF Transcript_101837/g.263182 Transcript_101837/m.263182 type:complete len:605 (+) Transcript_101837:79-1893(+)
MAASAAPRAPGWSLVDSSGEPEAEEQAGELLAADQRTLLPTRRSCVRRRCVTAASLTGGVALLAVLGCALLGPGPGMPLSLSSAHAWLRQLWSIRKVGHEYQKESLSECFFDAGTAALYLARGGLEIDDAVEVCPERHHEQVKALKEAKHAAELWHEVFEKSGKKHSDPKVKKAREWMEKKLKEWSKHGAPGPEAIAHERRLMNASSLRSLRADSAMPHQHDPKLAEEVHQRALKAERSASKVLKDVMETRKDWKEVHEKFHSIHSKVEHAKDKMEEVKEKMEPFLEKVEEVKVVAEAMHATKESFAAAEDSKVLQRLCAADIAGVLSAVSYVAGYVAALYSECQLLVDARAYCASDISRLFASIAETAAGGAFISATCTAEGRRHINREDEDAAFGRRLGAGSDALANSTAAPQLVWPTAPEGARGLGHNEEKNDGFHHLDKMHEKYVHIKKSIKEEHVRKAECSIDVASAVFLLGRAANEIVSAVSHSEHDDPQSKEERVAISIVGAIASFGLATQMISNAVAMCARTVNADALCASAIASVFGAQAELAASVAGSFEICGPKYHFATVTRENEHGQLVTHNPGDLTEHVLEPGTVSAPAIV